MYTTNENRVSVLSDKFQEALRQNLSSETLEGIINGNFEKLQQLITELSSNVQGRIDQINVQSPIFNNLCILLGLRNLALEEGYYNKIPQLNEKQIAMLRKAGRTVALTVLATLITAQVASGSGKPGDNHSPLSGGAPVPMPGTPASVDTSTPTPENTEEAVIAYIKQMLGASFANIDNVSGTNVMNYSTNLKSVDILNSKGTATTFNLKGATLFNPIRLTENQTALKFDLKGIGTSVRDLFKSGKASLVIRHISAQSGKYEGEQVLPNDAIVFDGDFMVIDLSKFNFNGNFLQLCIQLVLNDGRTIRVVLGSAQQGNLTGIIAGPGWSPRPTKATEAAGTDTLQLNTPTPQPGPANNNSGGDDRISQSSTQPVGTPEKEEIPPEAETPGEAEDQELPPLAVLTMPGLGSVLVVDTRRSNESKKV